MHTEEIVKELERERDRLSQAIAALQDTTADEKLSGSRLGENADYRQKHNADPTTTGQMFDISMILLRSQGCPH